MVAITGSVDMSAKIAMPALPARQATLHLFQ
jgi:hypothetical protein